MTHSYSYHPSSLPRKGIILKTMIYSREDFKEKILLQISLKCRCQLLDNHNEFKESSTLKILSQISLKCTFHTWDILPSWHVRDIFHMRYSPKLTCTRYIPHEIFSQVDMYKIYSTWDILPSWHVQDIFHMRYSPKLKCTRYIPHMKYSPKLKCTRYIPYMRYSLKLKCTRYISYMIYFPISQVEMYEIYSTYEIFSKVEVYKIFLTYEIFSKVETYEIYSTYEIFSKVEMYEIFPHVVALQGCMLWVWMVCNRSDFWDDQDAAKTRLVYCDHSRTPCKERCSLKDTLPVYVYVLIRPHHETLNMGSTSPVCCEG